MHVTRSCIAFSSGYDQSSMPVRQGERRKKHQLDRRHGDYAMLHTLVMIEKRRQNQGERINLTAVLTKSRCTTVRWLFHSASRRRRQHSGAITDTSGRQRDRISYP